MTGLVWPDPLPTYGPVRLRPYRDTDLDLVAELSADPYVPLIGTVPTPFTDVEGLAYLARQHERLADGTGWSLAIADQATDCAVGGAGLWLHRDRPATAGYVVAASARGRGYAIAALRALTTFAWHRADLDAVELFIEPGNAASLRVAERSGYRRVELHVRHTPIEGVLRDMWRYRLDRPDGS